MTYSRCGHKYYSLVSVSISHGVLPYTCATVFTNAVIVSLPSGWWFVNVDDFHEGWVPATYLEPLYGSEDPRSQKLDEEEIHITLNAYEAKHDDEISFEKGVLVEVFEKGFDGWWKIR